MERIEETSNNIAYGLVIGVRLVDLGHCLVEYLMASVFVLLHGSREALRGGVRVDEGVERHPVGVHASVVLDGSQHGYVVDLETQSQRLDGRQGLTAGAVGVKTC